MTEAVITSSVLILVVVLLRTALKRRVSSRLRYGLWLIAALRLLMPFELFDSAVSVMNIFSGPYLPQSMESAVASPAMGADVTLSAETFPGGSSSVSSVSSSDIRTAAFTETSPHVSLAEQTEGNAVIYSAPAVTEAVTGSASAVSGEYVPTEYVTREYTAEEYAPVQAAAYKKPSPGDMAILLWLAVAVTMLVWCGAVNAIFYRRLHKGRRRLEINAPIPVYVCGELRSPCIFGIFRPAIYVTEEAAEEKRVLDFVIAHELCHYYHGDIFWSVLRYFLLSVYWFDPLVWAAAVLSKRDCECACDEAVVRSFGEDRRFEYGKAIVDMIPREGGGMFGIASTSMTSKGRVMKERISFISRKRRSSAAAVVCTVLVMLMAMGCTFTSASSDISEDSSVNDPDTTAQALPLKNTEQDAKLSDLMGKSDFYINVTDRDGQEKVLFYMVSPTEGEEAFVYMDKPSGEPLEQIGYMPEISQNVPAGKSDMYTGGRLEEFITASRFSAADISRQSASGDVVRHIKSSLNGTELDSLLSAAAKAFPGEETADEKLLPDKDAAAVTFYRENGGFSSVLTVTFRSCGERMAARVYLEDYSDMVSLITGEVQPASKEKLEEAYASSRLAISEWFYADDLPLYSLCMQLTGGEISAGGSLSPTGGAADFDAGLFSVNIADSLIITGDIPEGFSEETFGNILIALPDNGSALVIGSSLFWQEGDMIFRLGKGSEEELSGDGISGTFAGKRCLYRENDGNISLVFEDSSGSIFKAVTETAEPYGDSRETALKILGSLHYLPGSEPAPYSPPVAIDSIPSLYSDENYNRARPVYSYGTYSYFRANTAPMLVAGFRVTDTTQEYETDHNCYIERKEPDGRWYRVLPLGEMIQEDSGYRHFYADGETGQIAVCLDLSCYPLLPEGEYRLVKPFRDRGGYVDKYAAFFDFTMGAAEPADEFLCTARCTVSTVSPQASVIPCEIKSSRVTFALSDIRDIERETPEGWVSVRKGPIHISTEQASFPPAFSGNYEIDTSDFDIIRAGNYRVRFSYGSFDDDNNVSYNGYDTAYAYFKVET